MSLLFSNLSNGVSCNSSASLALSGTMTVLAWVKPFSAGAGPIGNFSRIFRLHNLSNSAATAVEMYYNNTQGGTANPCLGFQRSFVTTSMIRVASNGILLNSASHVAAVYLGGSNSTDVTLYLNGVEQTVYQSNTNGVGAKRNASGVFFVGNVNTLSRWHNGPIISFDAYAEALSPEKILLAANCRTFGVTQMLATNASNHVLSLRLDGVADGVIASGSNTVLDYSPFSNYGTPFNSPTGYADEVLSYP